VCGPDLDGYHACVPSTEGVGTAFVCAHDDFFDTWRWQATTSNCDCITPDHGLTSDPDCYNNDSGDVDVAEVGGGS